MLSRTLRNIAGGRCWCSGYTEAGGAEKPSDSGYIWEGRVIECADVWVWGEAEEP